MAGAGVQGHQKFISICKSIISAAQQQGSHQLVVDWTVILQGFSELQMQCPGFAYPVAVVGEAASKDLPFGVIPRASA